MIYVIMSLLVYIFHFIGHVGTIIDIQTNHRK